MSHPARRLAAACLLAGLALTSCFRATGRDATYGLALVPSLSDLDGVTVVADDIDDPDREIVPGSTIRLSFTSRTISVNAGCNTFHGPAAIKDEKLVVEEFAATQKDCLKTLDEQDQWLTSFLADRPKIERVDDDVYLSHGDTVVHFVPGDV